MADYPLSPVKLSTIDETLPTGQEDASKLDDAIRQTRTIFKELLSNIMDDDGNLNVVTSLADDSVATAKLQNLAVTNAKLALLAVDTGNVVDKAVTGAKIANDNAVDANRAIGSDHLKDNSVITRAINAKAVTTAKINDKAVTGVQLANDASVDANRAVDIDHIKNDAVQTRAIKNQNVTDAKLKSAGSNPRMYWDSGSAVTLSEIDATGDIVPSLVSSKIKFTFASGKGDFFANMAVVVERGGSNAQAGTALATTFNVRPTGAGTGATDFVELFDPGNLITFVVVNDSGNKKRIRFAQPGTYFVQLSCAAYRTNNHFARLVDKTASPNVVLFETSANNNINTDNNQDYTSGWGVMVISATNTDVQLEHWTKTLRNNDGLGTPVTDGAGGFPAANSTYVYLSVVKIA